MQNSIPVEKIKQGYIAIVVFQYFRQTAPMKL